ncbi:MAG: hypothetical protein ACJ74G_08335 [Blastocatellia bacterium]
MSRFEELPTRIFLDSSTLQTLQTYGEFIWENYEVPETDRIRKVTNGIENLEALRKIFIVNDRAQFEFALSENSLIEVRDRGHHNYLQWAYDVLDHWQACLDSYDGAAFTDKGELVASWLDGSSFGYLGEKDRRLIQDAVRLECDAFLTMERRLPRNAGHIQRELGIRVLTPIQLGEVLQPWAGLFA